MQENYEQSIDDKEECKAVTSPPFVVRGIVSQSHSQISETGEQILSRNELDYSKVQENHLFMT